MSAQGAEVTSGVSKSGGSLVTILKAKQRKNRVDYSDKVGC